MNGFALALASLDLAHVVKTCALARNWSALSRILDQNRRLWMRFLWTFKQKTLRRIFCRNPRSNTSSWRCNGWKHMQQSQTLLMKNTLVSSQACCTTLELNIKLFRLTWFANISTKKYELERLKHIGWFVSSSQRSRHVDKVLIGIQSKIFYIISRELFIVVLATGWRM